MNTPGNNFIEVPEPLFKYQGNEIIHDDNLAIMSVHETATVLDKKVVKRIKSELSDINKRLSHAQVDNLLAKFDRYTMEYNSLKIDYETLNNAYNEIKSLDTESLAAYPIPTVILTKRLINAIVEISNDGKILKHAIKQLNNRIAPHRQDIRRRQVIDQKLISHNAALDDEAKTKMLQKGMAEEANIIIDQITRTLSRLGFSHSYTVGKKTVTDFVQFEYVYATPDQLQCKIKASKQGLWGGSVDLLPQGVYVTEIIKPKVMSELSVALEREVWSPHTSEDNTPFVNGAWIIVERLGLVEGIPRHVTYKQLMARYETADHSKLPVPAGLKRGRRINWVYLDSSDGLHFMFTGISGSGKSMTMRAMVSSVIEKQSPHDINFAFIDLKKQGDFREFETAPHCIKSGDKGIITNIDGVVDVLQRVRSEMHMRQVRIGKLAKNLIEYNQRVAPEHRMPRIVIVFDEYANTRRLGISDKTAIIDDICIEIGQVGRAAGISLWIGIQQPRRDNMPSSLRDNITTQFVGHQANVGAAQSVTGNRESLKLENFAGRMSANVGWKSDKVQMPFISEDDVKLAVQIARDTYGDKNPYELQSGEDTDNYKPMSNEQIVLNLAVQEFAGDLKAYPMYQILKGQLSRKSITDIIKDFAEQRTIEHEGVVYNVQKQSGNYYALIPLDDSDDSDYEGVSKQNQNVN